MSIVVIEKQVTKINGSMGRYTANATLEDGELTHIQVGVTMESLIDSDVISFSIIALSWQDIMDLRTTLDELVITYQKVKNKPK